MASFKCLIEETIYIKIYCSVKRIQIKTAPSHPPTHPRKKKGKKIKYVIYLGFLEFKIVKLLTLMVCYDLVIQDKDGFQVIRKIPIFLKSSSFFQF